MNPRKKRKRKRLKIKQEQQEKKSTEKCRNDLQQKLAMFLTNCQKEMGVGGRRKKKRKMDWIMKLIGHHPWMICSFSSSSSSSSSSSLFSSSTTTSWFFCWINSVGTSSYYSVFTDQEIRDGIRVERRRIVMWRELL